MTAEAQMSTRPATCKCGAEFQQPYALVLGVPFSPQKSCEGCMAKYETELNERQLDERRYKFNRHCPSEFQRSDVTRFPDAWIKIECLSSSESIGLVDLPGTCKTRMLWAKARKVAEKEGVYARNLTHAELQHLAQHEFEKDNAEQFRAYRGCKLLILDDFAKGALKGATLRKLFDLVDYRTSERLPIWWTSNLRGEALRRQFGETDLENHGEALLGRLADYSQILDTKGNSLKK